MKRLFQFLIRLIAVLFQLIKGFLKRHPELYTIPFALALWIISPVILRIFDPTAATFDAGIFQIIIFSIISLFVFIAVVWWLMKKVFGTTYKYIRNELKTDFKQLTPWQKVLISYGIFFLLLFYLVHLSGVLIAGRP